jgi:hypothetical protein
MICVARCECPHSKPIYNNHYCIQKQDCLLHLLDD